MSSETIIHATDDTFTREVLEADVPVLVDFWATWCGPCVAIAPLLENLATEFEGKAKVVKVDIDRNPASPARYGVRGIPTLLLFKGGEVVDSIVGNPGRYAPLTDLVSRNLHS